jgi:hypothetical protein
MPVNFKDSPVVKGFIRHFKTASYKNDGVPSDTPVILESKNHNHYVIISFKPQADDHDVSDCAHDFTSGYTLSLYDVKSVLESLEKGMLIAVDSSEFDFYDEDESDTEPDVV